MNSTVDELSAERQRSPWSLRPPEVLAQLWATWLSVDSELRCPVISQADQHRENRGVPVLITDKVNIWREIVADGAGLAGPDDMDGVIAVLRRWSQMSMEERARMATRARQTFLKRFEISRTASSLLEILQDVVSIA